MSDRKAIITIDGPSGSGKSTISRLLSSRLNYTYLDTGAMYRAVGLKIVRSGIDEADGASLAALLDRTDLSLTPEGEETRVLLDNEDVSEAIRTPEMSMVASRVSALPLVREKLTSLQRQVGTEGGIVAEGRDMGTVVFPSAEYKFFLDASPEERARRRTEQLLEKGQSVRYDDILEQIIKRDSDDTSRSLAPLKPAHDAIIVDSTKMNIEEVVEFMMKIQAEDCNNAV